MSKIIVFASVYPKKDRKDEAKKIIQSMIDYTRSEEGNEVYNFYEEINNDNKNVTFHLFEIYKNNNALDVHRDTTYYKNYRTKITDLLKKPIKVKILNSIDSI